MDREDLTDEYLKDIDWDKLDMAEVSPDFHQRIEAPISRFFAKHTKFELFEQARKRRIVLYPVNTLEDLVQNEQLRERDFWMDVDHPELDAPITCPGAVIRGSEAQLKSGQRAPFIGEHNDEVYAGELGLSKEEIRLMGKKGVI
jgi:crotonobetainyl-CoA:carnitine CoA-transferase CaiB-like acyl-CoA transferase